MLGKADPLLPKKCGSFPPFLWRRSVTRWRRSPGNPGNHRTRRRCLCFNCILFAGIWMDMTRVIKWVTGIKGCKCVAYFEGFSEKSALFALGKYTDTCIKLLWNFFSYWGTTFQAKCLLRWTSSWRLPGTIFLTLLPNVMKEACWVGRTPY